jgi:hypothetical protein
VRTHDQMNSSSTAATDPRLMRSRASCRPTYHRPTGRAATPATARAGAERSGEGHCGESELVLHRHQQRGERVVQHS